MSGKKAKAARKAASSNTGVYVGEVHDLSKMVPVSFVAVSDVPFVLDDILTNDELVMHRFALVDGRYDFGQNLVKSRVRCGELDILVTISNVHDPLVPEGINGELRRVWVRSADDREGSWAVLTTEECMDMVLLAQKRYESEGVKPPMSPDFPLGGNACDAIAIIKGEVEAPEPQRDYYSPTLSEAAFASVRNGEVTRL